MRLQIVLADIVIDLQYLHTIYNCVHQSIGLLAVKYERIYLNSYCYPQLLNGMY